MNKKIIILIIITLLLLNGCEERKESPCSHLASTEIVKNQKEMDNVSTFINEKSFQKDSISFFGNFIGDNTASFNCLKESKEIVDINYSGWYDTILHCRGYLVYVREGLIVGFSIEDFELSGEVIKSIGISRSELDALKSRSISRQKGSSVYFLPVYNGNQQLDEGLDFQFFENNKFLIGYSEKI